MNEEDYVTQQRQIVAILNACVLTLIIGRPKLHPEVVAEVTVVVEPEE